jgi:hypothetical protein
MEECFLPVRLAILALFAMIAFKLYALRRREARATLAAELRCERSRILGPIQRRQPPGRDRL